MKFFLFFFLIISFTIVNGQNNSKPIHNFIADSIYLPPEIANPLFSIDVLPPREILIPMQGGVFILNEKQWLISPNNENKIESFSFDRKSGDLLYVSKMDSISYLIATKKTVNDTISLLKGKTFKMFKNDSLVLLNGVFKNSSFLMHITKPKYSIKSTFDFDRPIMDVAIVEDIILLLTRKSIYILELSNQKIVEFYTGDNDLFGIGLLNKNNIIVSTNTGLLLLSLNANYKQKNVFIDKIGPIYQIGEELFIHSISTNQICFLNKEELIKLVKD